MSTWAYRVVTNLCTDLRRARGRRPSVTLDDAPEVADGAKGAVATMIEADRMTALQDALAQLPDRQRQAVVLRHIEGMANPEIAVDPGGWGRSGRKSDGARQAGPDGDFGRAARRNWDMTMKMKERHDGTR